MYMREIGFDKLPVGPCCNYENKRSDVVGFAEIWYFPPFTRDASEIGISTRISLDFKAYFLDIFENPYGPP